MPELPEVETVVRGLGPRLKGRRITGVRIRQPRKYGLVRGSVQRFRKALEESTITRIHRRGKFILMDLQRPDPGETARTWVVHLGMSGQLYACKPDAEDLPHTHLKIELASGEQVRLRDPRRFGRTLVVPTGRLPDFFAKLGPEPLEIKPGEFALRFAGRKAPVKNLLLNQNLISGVGNIYANEALFVAGIHPARPAVGLRVAEWHRLHSSLQQVLREAIAGNGTTIADYRTSEGQPGWYQNRLRVYDRAGEPCPRCGAVIRQVVLAGRSAQYCPVCQPRRRRR